MLGDGTLDVAAQPLAGTRAGMQDLPVADEMDRDAEVNQLVDGCKVGAVPRQPVHLLDDQRATSMPSQVRDDLREDGTPLLRRARDLLVDASDREPVACGVVVRLRLLRLERPAAIGPLGAASLLS